MGDNTKRVVRMVGDKFRFRFRKSGDLRFLSHLDLTRSFERMLRRAELPFKSTQGFHPTPRMIFALSLPLGVIGDAEVLELELLEVADSEEVRFKLNAQTPRGLDFHTGTVVPMKAGAQVRRVEYVLPIPTERIEELQVRIDALLAQDKVWVERLKPKPRMLNVRPYLKNLTITQTSPPCPLSEAERGNRNQDFLPLSASERGQGGEVCFDFWVTPHGTARVDEIIKTLGLQDLVDAGAPMTRRLLELHDEITAESPEAPPEYSPESAPLNHAAEHPGSESETPVATWGLSPNGPVVE